MKRILIVSFVFIALASMTSVVSAQNVNIGIKGGLNAYTLDSDGNDSYDTKVSFHLGLLGHIHLAEDFAMQPELVFSAQGAEYGDDLDLDLNYINIPVLFQYMFDNGFRLQAGPQFGILASAKNEGNDVKDNFKTADFGISLGASYVSPATGLGIDARYNHGLSKINDDNGPDTYNRGFQVGLFYLFRHRS